MEKNKRFAAEQSEDSSVVVGRNPVLELLKSEKPIEKIYILRGEREGSVKKIFAEAKARSIPVAEADKKKLDMLSAGNAHQGVAAIAGEKEYSSVADIVNIAKEKGEKPLIVVCDGVEDPHNLGAIIRSAECAGAHGLVISRHRCAAIGQTVHKSSAGAVTFSPIAKVNNIAPAIDELKEMGVWTFAADMDGEDYRKTDFDCACALVLGGEGNGVSRLVRDKCDFTVSIPMRGKINSLNVSAAAAVLVFKAAEKR